MIHVARAARHEAPRSRLTSAQWTCLRFLARAKQSTRTPSGFASFHATTRGTASQIVKSLEAGGLIARRRAPLDGRSVYFDLTEAGRAALQEDPLGDLIAALDALEPMQSEAFLATLTRLTSALAERRGVCAFGTCGDCAHFSMPDDEGYCACMSAPVAADEIYQLCASYCGPRSQHASPRTEGP